MVEEVYAEDVRAWLEGVPAPAPRIDVERMLAAGRERVRRRRRIRLGAGAVLTSLGMLVAVPATAGVWQRSDDRRTDPQPLPSVTGSPEPIICAATVLSPPKDLIRKDPSEIAVTAMDPTGRYVVGETSPLSDATPVVVVWHDGAASLLPATGGDVKARAVNASGVVAGLASKGGPYRGWVYRDGKITQLGLPPDFEGQDAPAGINAAGDIVGNIHNAAHTRSALVVWRAAKPDQPELLVDAPADKVPIAAGIRDDGTVVAYVSGTNQVRQWRPGRGTATLPVPEGSASARATAVRGRWAIGSFHWESGGLAVPVRWDLDAGTVEIVDAPPGYYGIGFYMDVVAATNAAGDLLLRGPRAILLRDGRTYRMPEPASGEARPVAVSDDGRTVAGSVVTNPNGPGSGYRPTLWRC